MEKASSEPGQQRTAGATLRCSWGERGMRAAPLRGWAGPRAPQACTQQSFAEYTLCAPGGSTRTPRPGEQQGQGHTGPGPNMGAQAANPCAWGWGRVREGQEHFSGSNVQANPQKPTVYGRVSTYSFVRHEKAKPLYCFASKGDGKLNRVLGFRAPGTGDSWILLKAIMTAERVCMGLRGWRLRTGAGRPLLVSQSLSSSSPCIESTVGGQKDLLELHHGDKWQPELQPPRSSLHTTGCGMRRRMVPHFGVCGVARLVFYRGHPGCCGKNRLSGPRNGWILNTFQR